MAWAGLASDALTAVRLLHERDTIDPSRIDLWV